MFSLGPRVNGGQANVIQEMRIKITQGMASSAAQLPSEHGLRQRDEYARNRRQRLN